MNRTRIYIALAIAILIVVGIFVFIFKHNGENNNPTNIKSQEMAVVNKKQEVKKSLVSKSTVNKKAIKKEIKKVEKPLPPPPQKEKKKIIKKSKINPKNLSLFKNKYITIKYDKRLWNIESKNVKFPKGLKFPYKEYFAKIKIISKKAPNTYIALYITKTVMSGKSKYLGEKGANEYTNYLYYYTQKIEDVKFKSFGIEGVISSKITINKNSFKYFTVYRDGYLYIFVPFGDKKIYTPMLEELAYIF